MNLWDLLKMGLRNLSRRKARTALTVVGVIIGTISIVSMVSIGIGINETFEKTYMENGAMTIIQIQQYNISFDESGAYLGESKQLLNDERPTINGDGRQSRDFTYIENVIEANLKACLAPDEASGEAFNVAYGGREYLIDIYYELTKALGKDIEPIFGPDRKGDIKHSNADISKAKRLLDYDPEYDFAKGLNEAIEWYKANL